MGRYGQALGRLDNGLFIKLTPNQATRLRILDDPVVQNQSYKDPKTGEFGAPRTTFSWLVWDYEKQQVRILSKGPSVLKLVDEVIDAWNVQEMPMSCDIIITQTGQSLQTRYAVQGVPLDNSYPPYNPNAEKPDLSTKLEGSVSIREFGEGVNPALNSVDSSEDSDQAFNQPPIEAYSDQDMPADGGIIGDEPGMDVYASLIDDIKSLKLDHKAQNLLLDKVGILQIDSIYGLGTASFYTLREEVDKLLEAK